MAANAGAEFRPITFDLYHTDFWPPYGEGVLIVCQGALQERYEVGQWALILPGQEPSLVRESHRYPFSYREEHGYDDEFVLREAMSAARKHIISAALAEGIGGRGLVHISPFQRASRSILLGLRLREPELCESAFEEIGKNSTCSELRQYLNRLLEVRP